VNRVRKRVVCMSTRLASVGLLLATGVLGGCASAIESSKTEDSARRAVPVAICIKPLPRHSGAGTLQTLTPEDYWSMVFPSYDASSATLDRSAPDCAGRPLLSSPELLQAEGSRTGPLRAAAEDVVTFAGPDSMKVVWLRTHRFSDGTAAGALALVRPREAYAEVYATGMYRGDAARSRLGFERLGRDILVTSVDEGCSGAKANQDCESDMTVFLSAAGQLVPAARFALDQSQRGQAAGVGAVQYRLTATPVFLDRAIRLSEQVSVRDGSQTEIRRSDLERIYELKGKKLVTNGESLWAQAVLGGQAAPASSRPPAKP
jgi:hypothetical protein